MKILLTGANGYIGKRLLPALVEAGHQVICLVRNEKRLNLPKSLREKISIFQGDLLDFKSLAHIPNDIDTAFYLVHSMGHTTQNFAEMETRCAGNFVRRIRQTRASQIIYLGGIVNDVKLSKHLKSRQNVEDILHQGGIPLTVLRAGIIIGSGSASFEIIRDLVEKLPVMVAPRWINNRIQPIAIHDVIYYMCHVVQNQHCFNKTFDIGGPNILNYKEMLLKLARVRGFKRYIFNVPVLTPRLSSYWLYFVTSTSFSLARSLVDSLKNEVVCKDNAIENVIPHKCLSYEEAVSKAFSMIAENAVISSWKDAWITGTITGNYNDYIQLPKNGCLVDERTLTFDRDPKEVLENIWSIGGERGWYKYNLLWKIRGYLDKMVGGVGLRRGRTNQQQIETGDALDFWRVLLADKKNMRLLLYAEMKLPGEAWLEFKRTPTETGGLLTQTATFRPNGLSGRLYWYSVLPFHHFVFGGMSRQIVKYQGKTPKTALLDPNLI